MNSSRTAALIAALVSVSVVPATGAFAQTAAKTPAKPGFFHRHATATGVVAAAATHHALKKSARTSKAAHKKLTFAQKHPTLSAIGAGVAAHHVAKHTK